MLTMILKNKRHYLSVLFILLAPIANAQEDGETLVRTELCYACHQSENVSIGPPWEAIAARHGGRKEVMTDVLVSKIIRGGGGSWGLIPMVPNQRVSEVEARVMVEWILGLTPD